MIHESLLFEFNSFQIIAFTHLYCWQVGLDGSQVTRRERINTENREIEKKEREGKLTAPIGYVRLSGTLIPSHSLFGRPNPPFTSSFEIFNQETSSIEPTV